MDLRREKNDAAQAASKGEVTTMTQTASYKKLNSGAWGIRVVSDEPVVTGSTVTVTKRDGSEKSESISKVLWAGGGIYLCAIVPTKRPQKTAAYAARRSEAWTPCGYPGCNPVWCDECTD
jgi:hypothetical protein